MKKERFIVLHSDNLPENVLERGWAWLQEEGDTCWCVVDTKEKTIVGYDGGCPEDQLLVRDWDWVAKALNDVDAELKICDSQWVEGEWDERGFAIIPEDAPHFIWHLIEPASKVTSWEYKIGCADFPLVRTLANTHNAYHRSRCEKEGVELRNAKWFWAPIGVAPPEVPEEYRRD